MSKFVKCPRCNGTNLQATTETKTDVKTTGGGYSGTKGCLGVLMLGPLGLLCGNCGQSQKTSVSTSNKTYWICSDCGNKFRNLDDLKAEIDAREKTLKNSIPLLIMSFVLAVICFAIDGLEVLAWIFAICAAIYAILMPVLKKSLEKSWAEYKDLEEKSTEER